MLTSRLCSAVEFNEEWFVNYVEKFHCNLGYHRKLWEICAIAKAVDDYIIGERVRAIGFGVGVEYLPSYFANTFKQIIATDLPMESEKAKLWKDGLQHSNKLQEIFYEKVFKGDYNKFSDKVVFDGLDMNNIPEKYLDESFDLSWSSCTFEHLGSVKLGTDFIKNQMRCLKKGGYAIHTTEFNCDFSDTKTFQDGDTVLFNKSDIDKLIYELRELGYCPLEPIYYLGDEPQDKFIDIPPYSKNCHLKLKLAQYTTTSIILIVKK